MFFESIRVHGLGRYGHNVIYVLVTKAEGRVKVLEDGSVTQAEPSQEV